MGNIGWTKVASGCTKGRKWSRNGSGFGSAQPCANTSTNSTGLSGAEDLTRFGGLRSAPTLTECPRLRWRRQRVLWRRLGMNVRAERAQVVKAPRERVFEA